MPTLIERVNELEKKIVQMKKETDKTVSPKRSKPPKISKTSVIILRRSAI
jgi:hypothetical protein